MRKTIAAAALGLAVIASAAVQAADMPSYPPIDIPPVDYGLGGSFYLRGSLAVNGMWSKDSTYLDCPDSCDGPLPVVDDVVENGYGYSFGAGFGYETGDGLRADVTLDYLQNEGVETEAGYRLKLRSTLALANFYYDFPLGGYSSAAGGFGAYVGAGLGFAHNRVEEEGGAAPGPDGKTFTAAGALMAGVTYDMGPIVGDLGWRGIYMPQISNGEAALTPPAISPYYYNDNFIHELRGTLRYRLQ